MNHSNRIAFFLAVSAFGFGQATLEDFQSTRFGYSSSYPLWSAYTGPGAGDNLCTTQTWTITGGFGVDAFPATYCPYVYFNAGAPGGWPTKYAWPNGYTQTFIKSGTWNANFNRFAFSITCTGNNWPVQNTSASVGTFVRPFSETDTGVQGQHYYHYLPSAFNSGQTYYYTLNRHPQHQRSGGGGINWPNDPEWVDPSDSFGPVHYFDGWTPFYIVPTDLHATNAGQCSYGPMTFSLSTQQEPDEDVSTVAISYDGSNYHVDWAGPKNVTESYTVVTATASMHANGFSTGSACAGAGTPTTPGDAYTPVNWTCAKAQVPTLYVAIRPNPVVIGATGNGVSPIRLSFAVDPMWSTNDQVVVSGVAGNTAANGTYLVTPHTWQIWNFGYTGGLSQIVVSGGTGTATTTSAHNLQAGQVVQVYNYEDSSEWAYGLTYKILTVPSGTTFTFSTGETAGTYNSGTAPNLQIWGLPSVDLQSTTGNGSYTSGGTAVATSNTTNFTEVVIGYAAPSPGAGSSIFGAVKTFGPIRINEEQK